jgi:hypothetical protein
MTKSTQQEEKPLAYYIQGIQSGTINPGKLSQDIILGITEGLCAEGSSTSQVAQALGKNERTVRRYLEAIRAKNALAPSLDLATEIIGELLQKARTSHAYLMRLARSQDGSIAEKAQAEYYAWRVWHELIERFQSVGYLPMKPKELTGDFVLHLGAQETNASFDDLRKQLKDIEAAGALTQEALDKINQLNQRIEKAEVAQNIVEIKKTQEKGESNEQSDTQKS